ncbi:hypothetical protein HYT84_03980 [Candidatus Micrarchaeota archaeon]|nr:hypothetical protein [Candidatus Micrarchaeota archaeon]
MGILKSKRGLAFVVLFILISLVGMNINFSKLVGKENQFFTLFQFLGPVAGGFLGAGFGVLTVLFAQLANFVLAGKQFDFLNVARLAPMLFAAYYFSKNKETKFSDRLSVIIPILAILIFISHPVGAQAWYFSLFWLIPIAVKFLPDNLLFRSLGATFTAHAVGGAIWAWSVPMTPEAWAALIPIVIYERLLFAVGISVSYILFTNILNAIEQSTSIDVSKIINIEKKYVYNLS